MRVQWDEVGGEWSEDPDTGDDDVVVVERDVNGVKILSGVFGRGMFFVELNGPKEKIEILQKVWDSLMESSDTSYMENLKALLVSACADLKEV